MSVRGGGGGEWEGGRENGIELLDCIMPICDRQCTLHKGASF